MPLGQELEVILKAGRVAYIHHALRVMAAEGKTMEDEDMAKSVSRMQDALDELTITYREYEEWKKENENSRN